MSQQQLTESQLPITHEVLIETETNFRNALTANKSTIQTKQIQIIKIIPPFSREIVRSAENLAQAYRSCASDILKQFPTTMQQKMTISKTITVTKDDRKLHTLTVIAPPEAEQFITSIKSEGIILLNRTVFPVGCFPRSQRPKNIYPKLAKIKLSNLPYVCNDIEAKLILQLPEDIIHSPIFQRETCIVTEPGQYVYTGRAILEVKIQNEEQEKKLKDWSYKSRMDGFKMWEGVEISFHIPSLHECQKCKMPGRQEKGHHDDWCNIGNQINKNPNNHYPQKPSSNNASDEKNDDETTSDKFCNGSENEEDKNVEAPPSGVLIDESKTNSAATPSEEKQKDEVLNNQVVDFHSYSAKEKKDKLNIENNKRKCSSDGRMLTKRERETSPTSWSVLTRKKGPKVKSKSNGEDLAGGKF